MMSPVTEARTTTVVRKAPRRASDAGRSRLGDLTRPIAREQRIAKNRRPAVLLSVVGVALAGAIGAALFVLPVRTWFGQNEEIRALEEQLDEVGAVNTELQQEVDQLQTDDGVMRAAREELGYIHTGELRETITDLPALPAELPAGWPYGPAAQIIRLRTEAAASQPAGG